MPTFAELGIPFPLFDAPVEHASDYAGLAACSLCGDERHTFALDVGCALMADCPACGAENGFDAHDRKSAPCRDCGQLIGFPLGSLAVSTNILVCYHCLRAGRAGITKDTELGMVSWEQAFAGVTHGTSDLRTGMFPTVETDGGWTAAVVPREHLFELLRTPTPSTFQGERWQFCCRRPMTFIGNWQRTADLDRLSPDGDGRAYLERTINEPIPPPWRGALDMAAYFFKCRVCSRETATWDVD